ncbi:MAG TPA: Holliday junction resolvase RuvX [Candidatus Paceibacterota bacterium]|nr:Holliday junction resolvase RuvX [Candidatus Paceibacterota bacterium]
MTKNKRYLGIDYGTKKLGIALSDDQGKVAFPREVVPNDHLLFPYLDELCQRENIAEIVIGESKNLSGEPNPLQHEILSFTHRLEKITGLFANLEPEYLTTRQAMMIQGRNKMTDASAAALILQSFLDRLNNRKSKESKKDGKKKS